MTDASPTTRRATHRAGVALPVTAVVLLTAVVLVVVVAWHVTNGTVGTLAVTLSMPLAIAAAGVAMGRRSARLTSAEERRDLVTMAVIVGAFIGTVATTALAVLMLETGA